MTFTSHSKTFFSPQIFGSIGLGKCIGWHFHDLVPGSWLWHWLAKISLPTWNEKHSFNHNKSWQLYPPSHAYYLITFCKSSVGSFLPLSPPGWRGIVVTVRAGGRAGGCQTCGTHISVTSWWIFSIRSSVELSRPVVVHCHGHLLICPIWACPWAKNLSNLAQIGSRLCGMHISETVGWIDPI